MGAVLLLALALTVYSAIALRDVPEWGRAAEHAWDGDVQASLVSLAAASARGVGHSSPVSASVPMATDPQSMDVPLLGPLEPLPPSGSVSFHPRCASFSASHTRGAATIADLAGGAEGCLVASAETSYAPAFSYRLELGGLLRIQGGRAVVVAGPPLELASETGWHRVGLTFTTLRGAALASSSAESVRVDLVPGASSLDNPAFQNAASATWTLHTDHASAWERWYERALRAAAFDPASYSVGSDAVGACTPAAHVSGCVRVHIEGPSVDPSVSDLSLALAHGVYDVSLR